MISIRRRKKRSVPSLNMASMPDLIFTVLFFFMLVTHMRTEEVKVKYDVPTGTEVSETKQRYGLANIYIGKVENGDVRIQVNDKIVTMPQVGQVIADYRSKLKNTDDGSPMTVNLRVDKGIPMGIVNDVKMELRRAGALTIRYSANEESNKNSEK